MEVSKINLSKFTSIPFDRVSEFKNKVKPSGVFIYLLVSKGEVVYVGQTTEIIGRVYGHIDSDKIFDSLYYRNINRADNELEAHLIYHLEPVYNKMLPLSLRYINVRSVLKGRINMYWQFNTKTFGVRSYFDIKSRNPIVKFADK